MITNRDPARLTSIGPTRVATIMPPIIGSSRTPVPSGSEPPTSWKYWGMTNSSPNNAKVARSADTGSLPGKNSLAMVTAE